MPKLVILDGELDKEQTHVMYRKCGAIIWYKEREISFS